MSNAAARALALAILVMMALSVIGLIAYARGPEHHRGDEIGTHGTKVVLIVSR